MDSPNITIQLIRNDNDDDINILKKIDLDQDRYPDPDPDPDTDPEILTIKIYHFIIGSCVYSLDFNNPELNSRNHEFPKIVETLLTNPEKQFSDMLIHNLNALIASDTIKEYRIIQYLILIDDTYKKVTTPLQLIGLYAKLNLLQIHHNSNSILHIRILPITMTEELMKTFIGYIKVDNPRTNKVNLVNIMDCTSHIMRESYIFNNSI